MPRIPMLQIPILGGLRDRDCDRQEKLLGLADRPGNDIRARLLLALTALYVERATHTEEEKLQYAELAQRLIDVVDETTRTAVAGILREHPTAAIEVSRRLSPNASPGANPAVPESARIPAIDITLATEAAASAHNPLDPADALDPAEWGEAFFAATAAARHRLLAVIARTCEGHSEAPVQDIAPADYERLDAAVLQGRIGEFIREFERAARSAPRPVRAHRQRPRSASPWWSPPWPRDMPIAVAAAHSAAGQSGGQPLGRAGVRPHQSLLRARSRRRHRAVVVVARPGAARRDASPPAAAAGAAAERDRPPAGLAGAVRRARPSASRPQRHFTI